MKLEQLNQIYDEARSTSKWYTELLIGRCFLCSHETNNPSERLVHLQTTHGIDPELLWNMCRIWDNA